MRFLVDECAGPSLARWLYEQGHAVFSVFDQARGINDDEVLQIALETERILISVDKEKFIRAGCSPLFPACVSWHFRYTIDVYSLARKHFCLVSAP